MKKIVLVLSIFFSYGYAIAESQYSYEELIEIQSVLLDSYSSDSDESIAISLSNVSYKIAEHLIQDFIANKDPSSIKDAIDSLDISISIFPNNKKFYLLKGDLLYLIRKYDALVGEIISGEIYQILSREVLLVDGEGNEISLPRNEQIYKDKYRKGDTLRGVISSVEMFRGNPKFTLSRTSPVFLEKLFENEVPEISDGLITIKKVVREPGERAKICVESYDDRIDPVGACVGMNGSRIHSIVRELQNENIDVINYTDNQELYISRALSPAKITSMNIDNEEKTVSVYLKPDQVSLAIGKGGQNIKLASRLLDLEIDVFRELDESQEEDVDIEEFSDEIEGWIIDELKKIGLDTAKSVLNLDKEDLIKRADLEESTIDEVISTLKKEFE